VQQAALGVLHEQLQCLPQTQRLVMEVSGVFAGWASLGRCPALAA
jgi:hypothetical protein